MASLGKSANDAVQMSFDGEGDEDDEGSNKNGDDDIDAFDHAREEMVDNDSSANDVAPQDLCSQVPEMVECVIPHDNTFTIHDLNDWLAALKERWADERLPVLLFCSVLDSKCLNYLEQLAKYDKGAICLDVDDWFINARYHKYGYPINPMGGSRHGVNPGRANILYIDNFMPSPCGVVNVQDFELAMEDITSGITKRTVNPADKQDVDEALVILSELARRGVYRKTGNLTSVVYCFISRTHFDFINLESDEMPILQRVVLCGLIKRTSREEEIPIETTSIVEPPPCKDNKPGEIGTCEDILQTIKYYKEQHHIPPPSLLHNLVKLDVHENEYVESIEELQTMAWLLEPPWEKKVTDKG
eukprot:Seg663.6 transcript_id=Seg663.6/GoldUCD/mRNA.D3Y31 product="hypothetical protein" protein_id=Seg663.6/GoldUCD/D3Y31